MTNNSCAIICIGDELISGHKRDSNSHWLAQQLSISGYEVNNISIIGDNETKMSEIFLQLSGQHDIVITTGGLGPTSDDLTMPVLVKLTDDKLVRHDKTHQFLKEYFEKKRQGIKQAHRISGLRAIKSKDIF